MRQKILVILRLLILTLLIVQLRSTVTNAQEMEPRAYSPSPIGTNFLAGGFSYSTGGIALDPAGPVTDLNADISAYTLGYVRTFALLDRQASIGLALPYIDGDVTGNVGTEARSVHRIGPGDARIRFASNLIGGPALTPEEFAQHVPTTTLGTSLTVIAPTGEYNSERLINIGSNRWAFKPELGVAQLIGDWFVEGTSGVWLYTDNPQYFGDTRKSQDPIASLGFNGGYRFYPGLWLSGNFTYYSGGDTTVDDKENDDGVRNSRYGATLAIPLSKSTALKLAWSEGFTTRLGSDFTTYAAALQYRWFD